MKKQYKDLISDTFIFAIGTVGSRLILFLLVPLYTTLLTTEEYGLADLVVTFGQMLLPVISLAIPDAVVPFGLAKDIKRSDVLASSLSLFVVTSLLALLIVPLFDLYYEISRWKWYVYIYVICTYFNILVFNYLKVCDKNKTYSILSIFSALLLVAFNILFLQFFHWGIKGYLMSTILSVLISGVASFLFGNFVKELKNAHLNWKLTKEMIMYAMPLIANAVSWWLVLNSNKILIQVLGSSAMLGLYTAASKIPSLINMVNTIFGQAWGLSAIKTYNDYDSKSYYTKVFRIFIIVMFISCIFLVGIIKLFMSIYVGDDFFNAWPLVPALMFSACYSAISSFCSAFYGTVRKSKGVMLSTLLAGLINVVINMIFIPLIGAYGAVIGTALSYIVVAIYRLIDTRKISHMDCSLSLLLILTSLSLIQVFLVSLDFHIYEVSVIIMLFALFFCRNDLNSVLELVRKK